MSNFFFTDNRVYRPQRFRSTKSASSPLSTIKPLLITVLYNKTFHRDYNKSRAKYFTGKVNFTETPEPTSAALGGEATLRCATNGRIERCAWSWRPLGSDAATEPTLMREFPSHGDLGRNCSLSLQSVTLEEQGYWTCQVFLASSVMVPPAAKLTVYEEGECLLARMVVKDLWNDFLEP